MSREIVNQMYSPSAFYLAKQLVSTLTFFFYPFIVSLSSYFFLGFPVMTFESYMHYALICALTAYSGSQYGFMMGTIWGDCLMAANMNQMTISILSFGGGLAANIGKEANWIIKIISLIAP